MQSRWVPGTRNQVRVGIRLFLSAVPFLAGIAPWAVPTHALGQEHAGPEIEVPSSPGLTLTCEVQAHRYEPSPGRTLSLAKSQFALDRHKPIQEFVLHSEFVRGNIRLVQNLQSAAAEHLIIEGELTQGGQSSLASGGPIGSEVAPYAVSLFFRGSFSLAGERFTHLALTCRREAN